MMTAQQYIEKVYGKNTLARAVEVKDVPSILDLLQDYGDYVREQESKMLNFIMDIDVMTTTEFCREFSIPPPEYLGSVDLSVADFFRVDAIKHKMFLEKAKELYRKDKS